ncbi:MAG: DUF3575 domain-containing protein [Phycisphaerales bacterium]|nr:DUF3575 domain-containing protein [Phycisphaerales bacterium]
MKKFIKTTLLGTCLVASSLLTNAQDVSNVVKVNPLGLLFGTANATYELKIGANSSVGINLLYSNFKFGDFKYSAIGGGGEYRYYFSEDPLEGWYLGGAAGFQAGKLKVDGSESANYTSITAGALGGRQWVWNSGFLIDLGLTLGYVSITYQDDFSGISGLKASGIGIGGRFGLGYAF